MFKGVKNNKYSNGMIEENRSFVVFYKSKTNGILYISRFYRSNINIIPIDRKMVTNYTPIDSNVSLRHCLSHIFS